MEPNKPTLNSQDMAMPRAEEIQYIHNFTEQFLVLIDKNPMDAKKIVHDVLRPYMAAQLRTIAILEDQVGGYIEQNDLLLISNAELIHNCKVKGVSLPNFDQIKRDYDDKKAAAKGSPFGQGIADRIKL
jgi:hypothetical protein